MQVIAEYIYHPLQIIMHDEEQQCVQSVITAMTALHTK